ncbi:MAG: metallophosphoesterase [Chloroflexota bacterium]|nr:metallophosphoesterase [Chloroflexota bacterium]
MNSQKSSGFFAFLLACVLAIFLGACSASPNPAAFTPLPTMALSTITATATPVPPTSTNTASSTVSPTEEVKISATATATPRPISARFAVIGDYGAAESAEEDVSNLVKSWGPDFIITTGDNNYPNGAAGSIDANIGQYYFEYIYPYMGSFGEGGGPNRFFPCLGNHDWNSPDAQPYLDYFALPGNERYYDFTWGPVHFFALDSDSREPDGVGASSTQAAWLKTALADSTAAWKIVYMHHPPYSSGNHGSIDWARWPFQQWGATAVLAGHDHDYERLLIDGFPYFVNGLGGGLIYQFDDILPGSQSRYNGDYGAMLVDATKDSLSFQFITRTGSVIDTYTISKGGVIR